MAIILRIQTGRSHWAIAASTVTDTTRGQVSRGGCREVATAMYCPSELRFRLMRQVTYSPERPTNGKWAAKGLEGPQKEGSACKWARGTEAMLGESLLLVRFPLRSQTPMGKSGRCTSSEEPEQRSAGWKHLWKEVHTYGGYRESSLTWQRECSIVTTTVIRRLNGVANGMHSRGRPVAP